jgi:hypothetical protein
MLFILTMDQLQRILQKASENGYLHPICPRGDGVKVSLYAVTATIFLKPIRNDIVVLKGLLDTFSQASGLKTNIQKSEIFFITCSGIDLGSTLQEFPTTIKEFPCCYLGLPLHKRKLRKIYFVPLLDKVGGKLPGWKGKYMTKAVKAQLVNSVMIAIVTYHVIVFPLPKWLIKKIDKIRHDFFWKGKDNEGNKGGICLVKWSVVCKPKELGAWESTTSTVLGGLSASGDSGTVGPTTQSRGRG